MVFQAKMQGKTYREVAECLNVDPSTVCRTIALFDETGNVQKKKYPVNLGTSRLTEIDKLIILELVLDKPGIYLHEIAHKLVEETGTEVNISTICRYLQESGFTRQKMIITATQRSNILRAEYLLDISVYKGHPELFVFIDETGADRRDAMRRFAYSLRGKPAVAQKLMVRGHRVSAIVAMSCTGIIDFNTTTESVNAEKFKRFVTNALVPQLRQFDGVSAHSVVVMDNASIHHVQDVIDAIQQAGALVQFLPPYSPDMNPIEHAFAQTKSVLKAHEYEWEHLDTETMVSAALNTITPAECQAWISHCGY